MQVRGQETLLRLRPEKPWLGSGGRGFDSRHLHQPDHFNKGPFSLLGRPFVFRSLSAEQRGRRTRVGTQDDLKARTWREQAPHGRLASARGERLPEISGRVGQIMQDPTLPSIVPSVCGVLV